MKRGSFRAICLIFMACIAVLSAFGNDVPPVIESAILETFNGESRNFDWRVEGSRFTTTTERGEELQNPFPRSTFVPEWPATFFGYNPENEIMSFGIWGRFDRRGYNWIDVVPFEAGAGEDDSPTAIPIPGRLVSIDMWVWGANFRYDLEAYFRDAHGMIHVIKLGTVNHTGWRNMRASIPGNISQTRSHITDRVALEFVKFRIWTQPNERVDNFFIYFNQLRAMVDVFEFITPFDGDRLANPERIQELWNGGE